MILGLITAAGGWVLKKAWGLLKGTVLKPFEGLTSWIERSVEPQAVRDARVEAEIAAINAKRDLALYQTKADLEWDLTWADAADRSWKDEALILLWTAPLIMLFVPGLRDHAMVGFDYLKATFGDDATQWYFAGWGAILATTFGMRQVDKFLKPGRTAKLIEAISAAPDDIPDAAMAAKDVAAPPKANPKAPSHRPPPAKPEGLPGGRLSTDPAGTGASL